MSLSDHLCSALPPEVVREIIGQPWQPWPDLSGHPPMAHMGYDAMYPQPALSFSASSSDDLVIMTRAEYRMLLDALLP